MDTKNTRTEPHDRSRGDFDAKPQARKAPTDEWDRDLNPDHMAGQNIGERSADREQGLPTAYDVKEIHRSLSGQFQDDELRQVPVLPSGSRLQQGATYLDLSDPQRQEFTARGDMAAGDGNAYVPKSEVPYSLWNRLIGVEDPERTLREPDRDR